ncbi:MAG: hypothetical protein K2X03_18230 [Bryobacteraceae bacterium]|nr:hypothetical protein [Bryobacteraceae bacterium]
MTPRAGGIDPLKQFELEAEIRLRLAIERVERDFQREFGRPARARVCEPGPTPWAGFLDLSLL